MSGARAVSRLPVLWQARLRSFLQRLYPGLVEEHVRVTAVIRSLFLQRVLRSLTLSNVLCPAQTE